MSFPHPGSSVHLSKVNRARACGWQLRRRYSTPIPAVCVHLKTLPVFPYGGDAESWPRGNGVVCAVQRTRCSSWCISCPGILHTVLPIVESISQGRLYGLALGCHSKSSPQAEQGIIVTP